MPLPSPVLWATTVNLALVFLRNDKRLCLISQLDGHESSKVHSRPLVPDAVVMVVLVLVVVMVTVMVVILVMMVVMVAVEVMVR